MNRQIPTEVTQELLLRNTTLSKEKRNDTLRLLGTYVRNRFNVMLFAERFLPFFCGLSDPNLHGDHMAVWYGISGGPSTEVELVDERNQVVAIVPAIFNTNFDYNKANINEELSFSRLLNVCALESNNIPTVGINNLRKALAEKIRTEGLPGIDPHIQQMWLNLFTYFQNHPAVIQSGAIQRMIKEMQGISSSQNLQPLQTSDEFEFD